jgi:hypothetical protein
MIDDRSEKVDSTTATISAEARMITEVAVHVGDQVHLIVKRHAMTMPTVASAMGMTVHVAAQVLAEALQFGRNSMDGDKEDEAVIVEAGLRWFAEMIESEFPGAIATLKRATLTPDS